MKFETKTYKHNQSTINGKKSHTGNDIMKLQKQSFLLFLHVSMRCFFVLLFTNSKNKDAGDRKKHHNDDYHFHKLCKMNK